MGRKETQEAVGAILVTNVQGLGKITAFSHLYLGTQGILNSSLYFRMRAQNLHIQESNCAWKSQGGGEITTVHRLLTHADVWAHTPHTVPRSHTRAGEQCLLTTLGTTSVLGPYFSDLVTSDWSPSLINQSHHIPLR